MSAIDDLIKARAEMPEGAITGSANSIEFAIRHRRIAGEFETPEDTAFFVLAAQKVPLLAAERDARDAAWARLVKAALDEVSTTEARQALRDLGVDVDAMMEET